MDVNRISGYIPGKIVFFLMQVTLIMQQWSTPSTTPCVHGNGKAQI